MKKIILFHVTDWVVMYGPDGDAIYGNHEINGDQMFYALQKIKEHPNELELEYEYNDGTQLELDLFDGTWPNNLSIIRDYQNK